MIVASADVFCLVPLSRLIVNPSLGRDRRRRSIAGGTAPQRRGAHKTVQARTVADMFVVPIKLNDRLKLRSRFDPLCIRAPEKFLCGKL
jgi:hypothetical protein